MICSRLVEIKKKFEDGRETSLWKFTCRAFSRDSRLLVFWKFVPFLTRYSLVSRKVARVIQPDSFQGNAAQASRLKVARKNENRHLTAMRDRALGEQTRKIDTPIYIYMCTYIRGPAIRSGARGCCSYVVMWREH
ncbi:hypothetical protein P5V15_004678 [Pogonomyrmex californicus]